MLVEAQIQFCKSWYGNFRFGSLHGELSARRFFKVCPPPHLGFLVFYSFEPQGMQAEAQIQFFKSWYETLAARRPAELSTRAMLNSASSRLHFVSWFSMAVCHRGM